MVSSILPLLRVVLSQNGLRSLCQFRLSALERDIQAASRDTRNASMSMMERVAAAELLVELKHKETLYKHELANLKVGTM
ncbi:MAG: hypothetical protein EXS69_00935 [Candidatus Zambryskibacteria bacterium]|nr:hypothetical protein [Candidatus Zambryskibacteria bacterium]